MSTDTRLERLTLTIAIACPCVTSFVLMIWAPGRVAPATYVVVVALLLGTATVALNTWKAAQATGSVGQLIYETNTSAPLDASRTRWDRWNRKYDRSAARGRIAAMMMLSAATTAIILATWLS
jgi:hypothetical protein